MSEPGGSAAPRIPASPRGRRILGSIGLGGVLLLVVLTGLVIWLLPFSVTTQMAVLFHTVAGLAVLVPLINWLLRHWLSTRKAIRSASKISAYIAFWFLTASIVAGIIVTWQATFGIVISHTWAKVHLWTGVLALPFAAFHVYPRTAPEERPGEAASAISLPGNRASSRPAWKWSLAAAVLLLVAMLGASASYRPPGLADYRPPASFRPAPGPNPFAPSNTQMENGKPVPPEVIGSSRACGAMGCHTAIYEEWLASAHRWSEEDQFFQAVRAATTDVQGLGATEKCGGCHAPVSMLSGYKDPRLGTSTPGYKEGDSCVVCHAVRHVDERGIGSYVLGVPKSYLYDHSRARPATFINHFLIRAYPAQHKHDYSLEIVRQAVSCAPCHKEYDKVGDYPELLQVETQYDDWKTHQWNTDRDPARRLRCQQCHMYYVKGSKRDVADPYDLAVGRGLEHRSHRFAAANQFMPAALDFPRASAQVREANEWLTGKREVPEIQRVWPQGPIVPLRIETPVSVQPGHPLDVRVVLTNKKAGHGFPTGPLNVVRVWIELEAHDKTGKEIFRSGGLDANNHVEAGSYVLRPIAITENGASIMTPDIWHPKGPRFRPAIFPGESESFDYRIPVSSKAVGPLIIHARLRYRKANQFFMDAVYPHDHREAPITDISSDVKEIAVGSRVRHGLP